MLSTLKESTKNPRVQSALVILSGSLAGIILGYSLRLNATIPFLLSSAVAGAVLLVAAWMLISNLLNRDGVEYQSTARSRTFWPLMAFSLLPLLSLPYILTRHSRQKLPGFSYLSPELTLLFLFLLSCGLVFMLLARSCPELQKGPLAAMKRRPAVTLAVLMVTWIALASAWDIFRTYYLLEPGPNTPMFIDSLRNVFSDRGPLFSTVIHENGSSYFGVHASFILYLFVPLFQIWPDYEWFLILSNIALGLTAVPIYLLSRRFFSPATSLLLVAVFLFNRLILSQVGNADSSEERFLPVLLISAFYFWHTRRFLPFLGFSILSLTVREDVGIVLVFFGILSLFQRRKLAWTAIPVLLGSAWFVTMIGWFVPAFSPVGEATRPTIHYGSLGNTNQEILITLLFKPWIVIKTMLATGEHWAFIYGIWGSFGFGVFLLSGAFILAIPALAETLLLKNPDLSHFNSSAIAAALFPAMVLGLARADRLLKFKRGQAATVIAIVTLFSTLALSQSWLSSDRFTPRYNYDAAVEIMEIIPDGATSMVPVYMVTRMEPLASTKGYHQVLYAVDAGRDPTMGCEYIVIDDTGVPESLKEAYAEVRERKSLALLKESVSNPEEFVLLYEGNGLKLYQRTGGSGQDAATQSPTG